MLYGLCGQARNAKGGLMLGEGAVADVRAVGNG
jgi:hypothetical protein